MQQATSETARAQAAVGTVTRLLELSGFEPTIKASEDEERISLVIEVPVDDVQTLVGPQGQTISAYQLLANRVVQRVEGDGKPISLDVAGFSVLREQVLERLAGRLAEVATKKNVELRVYGMNPKDRRSMHMALQTMATVQTFSEDEGIARRLVITRR